MKRMPAHIYLVSFVCIFFILLPAVSFGSPWAYSILDDGGVLGNHDTGLFTDIAVDKNNKLHISYFDQTDGNLRYATNVSGSWDLQDVDMTGFVGQYTSIGVDKDSNVHISYVDEANHFLKYATNTSGAWVSETVDSTALIAFETSITLDKNGFVHISYYDSESHHLKHASRPFGSWVPETVDAGATDTGRYSSIGINSINEIYIVYYDADNGDLLYAKKGVSVWEPGLIIDDSDDDVGLYGSMVIDGNDTVHVSYYNATTNEMKYAETYSEGWRSESVDSSNNVGQFSSIATDSLHNIWISYYDTITSNLRYARGTYGSWTTGQIDGTSGVGQYSAIILDHTNRVNVSYYDTNNGGELKYASNGIPLTVTKTGNGVVMSDPQGINCGTPADCDEMYGDNTIVTLKAMPDAGYHFSGWTAGCVSEALSCKVTLNAATNVHATFTLGPPSPVTWSKTLGAGMLYANQYLYVIQQTADGGYIGAGSAYNMGYNELYVVKLLQDGTVDWERTYHLPGASMTKASSIQQTAGGGYIVAGEVSDYMYSGDAWILKLDASGNVQWEYTYNTSSFDDAVSIQQTSDGGYVFAGTCDTGSLQMMPPDDFCITKIDGSGTVVWQKTYDGNDTDKAQSISQTRDGGYIVAGHSYSFNGTAFDTDAWIMKLDSSGNRVWQRVYGIGNGFYDEARSVQQTLDDGYVVAGTAFGEFWAMKLDSSGDILWQMIFDRSQFDEANSVQQTYDSGIIVAGNSDSNIWIMKLNNADGQRLWQQTYDLSPSDNAYAIQQTSDGGFIVAGGYFEGESDHHIQILKLDGNGDIADCPLNYIISTNVTGTDPDGSVSPTSVDGQNQTPTVAPNSETLTTLDLSTNYVCQWLDVTLNVYKTGTGGGTVRSSDSPNPNINCCSGVCEPVCSAFYNPNSQVILTAIPDEDSIFVRWSGACTGGGSCIVSMNNDKNVTAVFNLRQYTVSTQTNQGGSINPLSVLVSFGDSAEFDITVNQGFSIASASGCGGSLDGDKYYTGLITGDCTVTVNFVPFTHTVSTEVIPQEGGSINPTSDTVNHNATRQFTVTAGPGYHIVSVTGCGGSLSGTQYTTGQITSDCTVSAAFSINTYTVTSSSGPGGGISPLGTTTVNHGGTPAFTVTPNPGYHIMGVNGTCGGSLNGNTYTTNPVTGNCTVHAEFEINEYTVFALAGQGGGIDPASAKVAHGNTVQFTITPDTGYHSASVSGCGGTLSQSSLKAAAKKKKGKAKALASTTYTTGQITENCTVTATFEINAYTVTADAGPGGGISPLGTTTVNHGGTPAFTVTPNPGYHIMGVNGTCGGSLNGNTYTTNPVTGTCTVQASFAINEYTVATRAGQGGGIAPASAQVTHGNTAQFTITPDTGYHIASVSGCGGTLNGFVYTTGEISANCTVTAVFNIATYTVSILKSGAGSGSIIAQGLICEGDACSGEYAHGARIIFNVQPDRGFRVADIKIDGISIGAVNTFTFKKLTGNHSIEILFAPL